MELHRKIQPVESYLCNGIIQTFVNSFTNEKATVMKDVPQGSILGPSFYTIYINVMQKLNEKVRIQCMHMKV